MPRYLRLKEWGVFHDSEREPNDAYLAVSDASLVKRRYRLRTDADGFIRSGRDLPDDAPRVMVLGDSIVEAMFVPEDRRMCAVLESLLCAELGQPVRVLNGGMTGATTLHLLNLFLNKGLPLAPSLVVLMSGIVDRDAALRPTAFWTCEPRLTPIVHAPEAAPPAAPDPILPEGDFTSRLRLLRTFAATAALHDVPLVMATLPHRVRWDGDDYIRRRYAKPEPFDRAVALRRAMNACTRDACAAAAVPLIDLEQRLDDRPGLFYDEFHLNAFGCEIVAGELLAGLRERGALAACIPPIPAAA